jgi:hypothetical protein
MKRSILNAVVLAQIAGVLVCQSAFAQGGTLLFRNFGDGVNAPIYDLNGELLAPLPNYKVALYGGAGSPCGVIENEPILGGWRRPLP